MAMHPAHWNSLKGLPRFVWSDHYKYCYIFISLIVFFFLSENYGFYDIVHALGCCDDNLVLHSSFNWFQPVSVLFTIVLTMVCVVLIQK